MTTNEVSEILDGRFDMDLEQEVLTDKENTKTVPCRKCKRRCVVTVFATAEKVECLTCRGNGKQERKQEVQVAAAHTVNPATLDDLRDALINLEFRAAPICPLHGEHGDMELKSVTHSDGYGPRRLEGYDGKGMPRYDQATGESVIYQCNDCHVTVSFSTMHPMNLKAQNEARRVPESHTLASVLGVRDEVAA